MPSVDRVLETCLYVDDLETARAFYTELFGFKVISADERFCALNVGGKSVLLLFQRGASTEPTRIPGGVIPAHGGSGPLHFAFEVPAAEFDRWKEHLSRNGVAIESEVEWPGGSRSLYFRDPDGHVGELATPGLWGL